MSKKNRGEIVIEPQVLDQSLTTKGKKKIVEEENIEDDINEKPVVTKNPSFMEGVKEHAFLVITLAIIIIILILIIIWMVLKDNKKEPNIAKSKKPRHRNDESDNEDENNDEEEENKIRVQRSLSQQHPLQQQYQYPQRLEQQQAEFDPKQTTTKHVEFESKPTDQESKLVEDTTNISSAQRMQNRRKLTTTPGKMHVVEMATTKQITNPKVENLESKEIVEGKLETEGSESKSTTEIENDDEMYNGVPGVCNYVNPQDHSRCGVAVPAGKLLCVKHSNM
jgi:hypothetical protein